MYLCYQFWQNRETILEYVASMTWQHKKGEYPGTYLGLLRDPQCIPGLRQPHTEGFRVVHAGVGP